MGRKTKLVDESIKLTEDRPLGGTRINWYPGHMAKATRQIKEKLKMVDIVLEIRDARAPLTSSNESLHKTVGQKSRLIIVNKINLADPKITKQWEKWFEAQGEPYVFVNCLDRSAMKKVLMMAKTMIESKREINKDNRSYRMMIMGLPNTGKSTIINSFAAKKATKTADKPGHTRHQQWIRLEGNIELMDTPGIMTPNVESETHGLWLCAIHAIKDEIIGEERVACYVVQHLLDTKSEEFKKRYKLESLDITVGEAFEGIAKARQCIKKKGVFDFERCYSIVLFDFRNGELGQSSFEIPPQ
jgi:ribosome biogenesis GTPase A